MAATGHSLLIPEDRIRARVGELARAISADRAGGDPLVLVGVLRGSFIFLADLVRRLEIPVLVDFVAVSSYPSGTSHDGDVRLVADLRTEIAGKHVLVVDDIVDTGRSLRHVVDLLAARRPASLATCVLLRKPGRLEVDVRVDYAGFDIPDVWVVGYGLDCGGMHRGLPYVASLDEKKTL